MKPAKNIEGSVVYTHPFRGKNLYINLTPTYACTNQCVFCNKQALERFLKTSLWLKRAPSTREVLQELRKKVSRETPEIVFCGIGEPTLRLNEVLKITRAIKKEFPWACVRLDTNGQAQLLYPKRVVVRELKGAGVDAVSVSFNALDAREYNKLCNPRLAAKHGLKVFEAVKEFVKECIRVGLNTQVSFIKNIPRHKINKERAIRLAQELGVGKENVLFRPYVS